MTMMSQHVCLSLAMVAMVNVTDPRGPPNTSAEGLPDAAKVRLPCRTFEIPSHDYFLYRLTVIVIDRALMSRKKARGLTRLAGSDLSAPRDRRAPPYLRRAFTCEFFHVKRTRDGASARVPHADPAPRPALTRGRWRRTSHEDHARAHGGFVCNGQNACQQEKGAHSGPSIRWTLNSTL